MKRCYIGCALSGTFLLLLTSCGGTEYLRAQSAGHVGCAPEEIVIRDSRLHAYHRTWSAICGGKLFRCTADQQGHTACSEQVEQLSEH